MPMNLKLVWQTNDKCSDDDRYVVDINGRAESLNRMIKTLCHYL